MNNQSARLRRAIHKLALGALAFTVGSSMVQAADDTFKIGIVTFLSGGAAESFGVPAWDGGKLLIEMLNEGGRLPAPYGNQKGFGGMRIEPVVIDEAGGATKQVQEFRNLVQRENVDAVVGYVSSGDCLAVPSVAEELKAFTILYDCGTPRVFEEKSFKYVFRSASHATMDNLSLARYITSRNIKVGSFAGINQNYAWGQDSWADFVASLSYLQPNAKVKTALFPQIFAGQYGTEISALMRAKPDLMHSSLWGGDLQAFILQSSARGLNKRMRVALAAGDHVIPQLGKKMPDGIILGARGCQRAGSVCARHRADQGALGCLQGTLRRVSGASAIPHVAGAARLEDGGGKGNGGQWRAQTKCRGTGRGDDRARMGCPVRAHPDGARRWPSGDSAERDRHYQVG